MAGLILKEKHTGQELRVLVISIQDCDGEIGAGVVALCCVHLLTRKVTKLRLKKSDLLLKEGEFVLTEAWMVTVSRSLAS